MFLFWLTIFSVIVALSFLLTLRSMKNSAAKLKPANIPQALYLIRHPEVIDSEFLEKLHLILLSKAEPLSASFEKLFKGGEKAQVMYGPTFLADAFPELGLMELEDYLIPKEETFTAQKNVSKVNADQVFGTQIKLSPEMSTSGLTEPVLGEEEQLFIQLILQPVADKKEDTTQFKLTFRVMVSAAKKDQKVHLARKVLGEINSNLGLSPEDLQATPNIFEKYHLRIAEGEKTFDPNQSLKFLSL